jgi:hypothetical protein
MKKILTLLLTVLVSCTASAQSTEYYYFADSVIGIFAEMRDSCIPPQRNANLEVPELMKSVLANSVRNIVLYKRIMTRLEKFKKSKDEGIGRAATLLSVGVLSLEISNEEFSNYLEKLLNDPKQLLQQGTVSRKIAELSESADSSWKVYAQTGGAVTFSLVEGVPLSLKDIKDSKKMQQKLTKLRITKDEIDGLKNHLQKSFGPILSDNSKAGFADIPAIKMWEFLNDKWTPAIE